MESMEGSKKLNQALDRLQNGEALIVKEDDLKNIDFERFILVDNSSCFPSADFMVMPRSEDMRGDRS